MPKTLRNHFPTLLALAAFIAFTLLVATAGCASTPTGIAAHAGRYELRAVDGRPLPDDRLGGAIAGELVLRGDGRARRVVQYATSGIPGPIVTRASGTYHVRGSAVTFDLDEELRPSGTRRRRVRGETGASSVTLRYPGRGNQMVEELYVRVAGPSTGPGESKS